MIDRRKPPLLVSALMALVVGVSASACENSGAIKPAATVTAAASASPNRIPALTSLLTPLPLEQAQIFTYNQGVIVNLTRAIDLGVDIPNLRMINTDPRFGLNLTAEDQVITYFFPQSFVNNDSGREEAIRIMEQQLPEIVSMLRATQGIEKGRMRFAPISVADALLNLVARNRLTYPPSDPLWKVALGLGLTNAYVGVTGLEVFDTGQIQGAYPDIPANVREALVQNLAYPFTPRLTFPTGYFRVLGLDF